MATNKKTKQVLIWAGVIVALLYFAGKGGFLGAVTGTESVDRIAPTSVDPGSTFQVTYTSIGTSGSWGASIQDSVSGGCTFPSGSNTYKTVMLSEDGNSKTITMTAPASGTSCVFSGDYKFGEFAVQVMAGDTVDLCLPHQYYQCTSSGDIYWFDCHDTQKDVYTDCPYNECQGGMCCAGLADAVGAGGNCDNVVSREELGNVIAGWIGGQDVREQLGIAIQLWTQN